MCRKLNRDAVAQGSKTVRARAMQMSVFPPCVRKAASTSDTRWSAAKAERSKESQEDRPKEEANAFRSDLTVSLLFPWQSE